jgi:hypothetical protein
MISQEKRNADIKTLTSGNWDKVDYFGINIVFKEDGSYILTAELIDGGYQDEGRWEIKNGAIDIYQMIDNGTQKFPFLMGCILYYDLNAPQYPMYIHLKGKNLAGNEVNNIVYNTKIIQEEGKKIKLGKKNCIVVVVQNATATENLNFRTLPSLDGKIIEVDSLNEKNEIITAKFLKKGTDFIVLARTELKEKVGSWDNYWYYIKYTAVIGPPIPVEGWVFGEFVKFIEQK